MISPFRSIALPIILGVLFLGLYVTFHLGIWSSVEIQLQELPDRQILFKEHRGAYHEIDRTIVSLETWAKETGVDCSETFAEFFDDPHTVADVDLRSRGGCIIQVGDTGKIAAAALPEGCQRNQLAGGPHLVASFPGSPAIAQIKVYPRLREESEKRRMKPLGPIIHLYKLSPSGAFSSSYQQRVEPPPL